MKIDCLAIDDEPLALDIIRDYSAKVTYLNLIALHTNVLESLEFLKTNRVDLLFLDIQMEELTGIQLLNVLKAKPMVIFTTAYDRYAVQGYELDIIDYLLKPISFERFIKAVDKVFDRIHRKTEPVPIPGPGNKITPVENDYIFVKSEFHLEKVKICDIIYIEGMGDYLMIHTRTKKIMTLQNFRKAEDILPTNYFCRVHKSFIVAIDKIESIERNRIKIGDTLIPVSESYRKTFFYMVERNGLI